MAESTADPTRSRLTEQVVASLPTFDHRAESLRDFDTPYGRVGYRQAGILGVLRHRLIPPAEVSPTRLA